MSWFLWKSFKNFLVFRRRISGRETTHLSLSLAQKKTLSRVVRYAGFAALSQREPAWAATIHTAQGGESPAVVLVLDAALHAPALSRRLLYTALTRARRCVVVVADERALAAALAPERGGGRRTSLVERLAGEAARVRRDSVSWSMEAAATTSSSFSEDDESLSAA